MGIDDQDASIKKAIARAVRGELALFMMGGGDYWGENPHDSPPTGRPEHYGTFAPNYVTLLYLGLEPNWSVRVNHASYLLQSGEDRLDKAKRVFTDMVSSHSHHFRDFPGHVPYPRSNGHLDSEQFADFRFKSQTEIFIFLHQPVPRAQLDVTLDSDLLLSFAAFAQERDTTTGERKPADRNYSFFNASAVSQADLGPTLYDNGCMIRVENWVTGLYGVPVTTNEQLYSMNIHFTIPRNGGVAVPMIFDPDTGNGAGNEP